MSEDYTSLDQDAIYGIRGKGTDAVRRGFQPEHVSGYNDRFLLQIVTLPSFTSVIGWQIYQRDPIIYRRHPVENEGKPRFIGCRTEWMQEQDIETFASPVKSLQYLNKLFPAMRFRIVEIEPQWIQERLSRLYSISLPPLLTSTSIGLDGVRYEVFQDGNMTHSRLNWRNEGPEEWRPLTEIVFSMLEELEGIRAYDAAMASNDEVIPFDQVIAEIEQGRAASG